jgi:hypothetical protein
MREGKQTLTKNSSVYVLDLSMHSREKDIEFTIHGKPTQTYIITSNNP